MRPRPSWPPRCTSFHSSSASVHDLQTHRARSPLDHLHRLLGVICVEILSLRFDDLADLLSRDPANLFLIRLRGTLFDTGRPLQQVDCRWSLEDERETAVLVEGDKGGYDVTSLRSGALVVGLGEFHDIDSMRAKRRAHRGCRRGLSRLQLELEYRSDLLLTHLSFLFSSLSMQRCVRLVDLFDLQQVELDRSLASEHVDEHLELSLLGVDLVDLAVEVGERSVDDAHGLTDLELDPNLRRLLLHLLLDRADLFLLERHRAVR